MLAPVVPLPNCGSIRDAQIRNGDFNVTCLWGWGWPKVASCSKAWRRPSIPCCNLPRSFSKAWRVIGLGRLKGARVWRFAYLLSLISDNAAFNCDSVIVGISGPLLVDCSHVADAWVSSCGLLGHYPPFFAARCDPPHFNALCWSNSFPALENVAQSGNHFVKKASASVAPARALSRAHSGRTILFHCEGMALPMSQMGQTRRSDRVPVTSGLTL
jgi:hypothetical protein